MRSTPIVLVSVTGRATPGRWCIIPIFDDKHSGAPNAFIARQREDRAHNPEKEPGAAPRENDGENGQLYFTARRPPMYTAGYCVRARRYTVRAGDTGSPEGGATRRGSLGPDDLPACVSRTHT